MSAPIPVAKLLIRRYGYAADEPTELTAAVGYTRPDCNEPSDEKHPETSRPPRVVIVGAGFGGLAAAKALRRTPVQVTLVDRRNYHLFQPLLYQVATAGLSPADIAAPIRGIVRGQSNTSVLLGVVQDVDTARREVILEDKRLGFDYLIVATGSRHAYADDKWECYAPGLKKIEDATNIRSRILMAFEKAEATDDLQERESLLTFVIVGGGPTGVEMAGAIAELAQRALMRDFRNIDPCSARILLLQRGPRVLPMFPESLSRKAQLTLESLGVEVHANVQVDHVDDDGAIVGDEHIRARTVIWAAGVMASPAGRWLGVDRDPVGRVKVQEDMSVPALENVFVIGDTALAFNRKGKPLPGLAPVAKQQGKYVARVIDARVREKPFHKPFRYRDFGRLATVGRSSAVADIAGVKLSGCFAWMLWSVAHVFFLIGFRSKITRLDVVERCSRFLSHRLPQQNHCDAQLAVALPHLPARHAVDSPPPALNIDEQKARGG